MMDRATKERWAIQLGGFALVLIVTFVMALWGDPAALQLWGWAL